MSHHFFEHPAKAAPPPTPRYFLDFLQRCTCTRIRIITSAIIMGPPNPPATVSILFTGIDMPSYLNHIFSTPSTRQLLFRLCYHDLLVMLGMLAGHAGDVENDAGDVDWLVQNTSISRENAVKYDSCWPGRKTEKIIMNKMGVMTRFISHRKCWHPHPWPFQSPR